MDNSETIQPQYHASVGYCKTDFNPVTECLDLDQKFKVAYEMHQDFMRTLQAHNVNRFDRTLRQYYQLDNQLDTTIKSLGGTGNRSGGPLNHHIQTIT
ncbi:hypothetical protein [Lactiplantibacillus pentosus]|uniref:hypothetical protein n=1 Tax=Lactiplantibacillus pentosus TaxID=1589 RepID=UPI0021A4779A|nr:hypothetical protein [Lactiplantibacillus pentosus]MCT3308237.1 hypothetical protein [Lactiplantibacillus pentosus]